MKTLVIVAVMAMAFCVSADPATKPTEAERDASTPEIFAKSIELTKEKYQRKRVKLLNCRFVQVSNAGRRDEFHIVGGQLRPVANADDVQTWINVVVYDSKGEKFKEAFAVKGDWAEKMIEANRDDLINLYGYVVGDTLLCDKIVTAH